MCDQAELVIAIIIADSLYAADNFAVDGELSLERCRNFCSFEPR